MSRLCCRAQPSTWHDRRVGSGGKSIAQAVVEGAGRKDEGRPPDREVVGTPKCAEVSRVGGRSASCGIADRWWRTKLDFGSGEAFDDSHRSTALRAAPRRSSLCCRRRAVPVEAVVRRRATESKAAGAWRACDWRGSRSYGCARSLSEGYAVRSAEELVDRIEATTSVYCDQRNHASEK